MHKILIIGGTSESNKLADALSDSFITKIDRTLILYGSTIHLDGSLKNYEA